MLKEKIKLFEENSIGLEEIVEDSLINMLEELSMAIKEELQLPPRKVDSSKKNSVMN